MQGLYELNYAVQKVKQLEAKSGEACNVDFVFQNEWGEQIGVRTNKEGITEFVTKDSNSATVKSTLDKVRQTYAKLKILDEVKRKGYQNVKEERLADGSIRLVVQKWQ
jgi:hypothetical protein